MPANRNVSLSPITGKMVHLSQTLSAPPAEKDKQMCTSTSRPHEQYSPMWPPPPLYYPFLQPPTAFNSVTHIFNNHIYHINECHSPKVSCSHHSSPSRPSHHHSSHAQPPKIPTSTHYSRPSAPSNTNRPIEPPTYTNRRPPHATKAKGVHFTESVSAREKERKKREEAANVHQTNHASKSGKTHEAMKVERLCCEKCYAGSQRWRESGSGRGVKLCEECYRARERKRLGRR